jgi:nucleotide-binding universal stress UspA family protein
MSDKAIVVGVDGSLMARIALDWAVAEARAHGWAVHVVHVWSVGAAADLAWLPAQALHRQSVALLTEALRDTDENGVAVTCASIEGDPATVLVEVSTGAAMLVLASHRGLATPGRPPGSVTASCLRNATVPVVVVPTTFADGGTYESGHPDPSIDKTIPGDTGPDRARP